MNTADVELLRKNTECKKVKKRERGMVGGKKKVFLMTSRLQNLQKDERREG